MKTVIVQLPFPSQADPNELLVRYYRAYSSYFESIVPGFKLRAGDLWEAPLWVAHLDAAIGRDDTRFEDLSLAAGNSDACVERLRDAAASPSVFLFSPLAQNFDLAMDVSERLMRAGHVTVLGGNMVGLERPQSFSMVYAGHAHRGFLDGLLASGDHGVPPRRGRQDASFGYRPNYRFLARFSNRVPLVRINASHGCLFGCSFCGDAWSRQLHVLAADDVRAEFEDIARTFPDTSLIYVGDKTFGQSEQAVASLIAARPPGRYTFIVQTHVLAMSDRLLDQMEELGVAVVEMGFETADAMVLRRLQKRNDVERYLEWVEKLSARGIHVILNLLGGLPYATELSHRKTLAFLAQANRHVKLYNLYNFVPYPKTPIFAELRPRIVDWSFANWREDQPVVFTPYHQTSLDLWQQFLDVVSRCDTMVRGRVERERRGGLADECVHRV
jgi:pyruvate-formate lyase-activating enzyme